MSRQQHHPVLFLSACWAALLIHSAHARAPFSFSCYEQGWWSSCVHESVREPVCALAASSTFFRASAAAHFSKYGCSGTVSLPCSSLRGPHKKPVVIDKRCKKWCYRGTESGERVRTHLMANDT